MNDSAVTIKRLIFSYFWFLYAATEANSHSNKIETNFCTVKKKKKNEVLCWMFSMILSNKSFLHASLFLRMIFLRKEGCCFLMCNSTTWETSVGVFVNIDHPILSHSLWACFGVYLPWTPGAKATNLGANRSNYSYKRWLLLLWPVVGLLLCLDYDYKN